MKKITYTDKAYLKRKKETKELEQSDLLMAKRNGDTIKWINYNKKIKEGDD